MATASEFSIAIWPGSSSFTTGSTPFGLYDTDATFQSDADKFAKFAARGLGAPIVSVELQDVNFYACLEEAVSEYSSLVNQQNIKDNMISIAGASTGSDMTHRLVTNTFNQMINIAADYGSEAGVGGNIEWRTGSIYVTESIQDYDLNVLVRDALHSGEQIEIKEVLHFTPPAIRRYFDPLMESTLGMQSMLGELGFGNMSPAIGGMGAGGTFMMMPIFADLLRLQAIELNDTVRKSGYGFHIINNKFKIFPIPTKDFKVYFRYIVKSDRANALRNAGTGTTLASDPSNAPFSFMTYSKINSVGKRWIWDYGLACAMGILGWIRSKYSTIPIPGGEVTLNGPDLINQSQTIKTRLLDQMKTDLESLSKEKQMERAKNESQYLNETIQRVPLKIYIGALIPFIFLIQNFI